MKEFLVIDDEPHVRRITKMNLKREGYSVTTANNGAVGLDEIRRKLPDVVIVDIDMPIMNGLDMCKNFIQEFPDSKCQIFISTSRTENELREWTDTYSNIHFIEKPMSFRNLLKQLSTLDESI